MELRFTLSAPWSVLLDDARGFPRGVTLRAGGFQEENPE